MEKEREFYVWDSDQNKMMGMKLTDNGIQEVINDSLSGKECTSVSSQ